jgi:NAD+ diphosphatase
MLGFSAKATSTEILVDGNEIAEARWFSRTEIKEACESGDIRVPARVSIARKIIEAWYGSEMPEAWSRT